MGVGSENKGKDMLRPKHKGIQALNTGIQENFPWSKDTGGVQSGETLNNSAGGGPSISGRPLFAANNTQREIGFDDGDEEYPPEPSPSPVPEPPPVEEGHPDMEKYEEEVGNYLDAHDAWEKGQNGNGDEKYPPEPSPPPMPPPPPVGNDNPDMKAYEDALKRYYDAHDAWEKEVAKQKWLSKYNIVKNDPNFNTTGIVSDQSKLGNIPYGSKGNAADNCCGAVAAHNALALLGEDSNFADVYTDFNDDSKLNLGFLAGGKLGTNPFAVAEYLQGKGRKVTVSDFRTEELENPGTYILVYVRQDQAGSISAHFQTAKSDGSTVNTYNNENTYFIGGTNNNSGDDDARPIEDIKSKTNMLETGKSWLLDILDSPINKLMRSLTGDDTYFSYIMKVE